MPRLLFTKEGPAVWMSHLDLMRLLGRAFRRAGLMLKHSQGFSPHPELSILMPLSVGVSSQCEIADFTLETPDIPVESIAARLNAVLPEGIRVRDSYSEGKKAGKLAWLRSRLTLTYDRDLPDRAEEVLRELFGKPELPVEKHSKKGPVTVDIVPMVKELSVTRTAPEQLTLEVVGAAQNPTLNPLLLVTAIEAHLPEYKPDFVQCRRMEVYLEDLSVFR